MDASTAVFVAELLATMFAVPYLLSHPGAVVMLSGSSKSVQPSPRSQPRSASEVILSEGKADGHWLPGVYVMIPASSAPTLIRRIEVYRAGGNLYWSFYGESLASEMSKLSELPNLSTFHRVTDQ